MAVQRRLAAAGYSRLAGEDETGTDIIFMEGSEPYGWALDPARKLEFRFWT